jgi:anthranilate 1,2-dioxygenase reductase component
VSSGISAAPCARTVRVVFSDSREYEFTVSPGETVLEAAARLGVPVRSECQLGTCGTCKAKCLAGTFDLETRDGLTTMERRRGWALTCVMRPLTDCVLEFPYPGVSRPATVGQTMHGTIIRLEMVCNTVCRVLVDLGAGSFDFAPGQYVNIEVPGSGIARSYSMANAPGAARFAEFFIRLLPAGVMSDYLRSTAREGQEVRLRGPFGSFFLRKARSSMLMVAGGTGLAPMLSILQHLVDIGETHQPIVLLFGANSTSDLFCLERLKQLQARFDTLIQQSIVLHASTGWTDEVGHVTALLRSEHVDSGDLDAYVCGPPPMIEAAIAWLVRHGVPEANIFAEKFLPS